MDNEQNLNRDKEVEEKLINYNKVTLPYLSLLLEYSEKHPQFLLEQPNLYKKSIEIVLKNPQKNSQINKNLKDINNVKTKIINFFSTVIDHTNVYDNDWLTCNINKYFKLNLPKNKQFYYSLEVFSQKISNLEFNTYPMSENVQAIANGNSCIELFQPMTFHCNLNISKLAYQKNGYTTFLHRNIKVGLEYLNNMMDKDSSVSYSNNFRDPREEIYSIVILHYSPKLKETLPKFINYLCHDIDHRIELTPDNMSNIYLKFEIENELENVNAPIKKVNKI